MNFASVVTRLVCILGITILIAMCWTGPAIAQANSTTISNEAEGATHFVPRYVIGTGGVMGANGTNYFHMATAGQTCAEGLQGANNWLFSGFWVPGEFGPTEVHHEGAEIVPRTFQLHQNYPNPFNPRTTIRYDLPYACYVSLEIFNVVGQRICQLQSKIQGPGYEQVVWDGRDDEGKLTGSGVYFYQVTVSATGSGPERATFLFQQTGKMLFVK